MADIATVLISGGIGLAGAFIGATSAQIAARKTRDSDRRKRCVERVLKAAAQLEVALLEYAIQAVSNADDPRISLALQASERSYNQSAEMLGIKWLREDALRYRDMLINYYLRYGQPRDKLESKSKETSLESLNQKHVRLVEKLRHYETT